MSVYLFAAARAAASGREVIEVAPGRLHEVLAEAVGQAPGLGSVLPRCSVLVDGAVAHGEEAMIPAGARIDVLPPFAGG